MPDDAVPPWRQIESRRNVILLVKPEVKHSQGNQQCNSGIAGTRSILLGFITTEYQAIPKTNITNASTTAKSAVQARLYIDRCLKMA